MFRFLFYLLGIVLAISIFRSVVGVIGQLLANLLGNSQATAGGGAQPRRPAVPVSEALKKDPVCGAYVAPSTAVTKTVGAVTYYYCSAECSNRHRLSA